MSEIKNYYPLAWYDPRTGKSFNAGHAFYNENYGEYFLKILEEPHGAQYFLKPVEASGPDIRFRIEKIIKSQQGKFLKRVSVGDGYCNETTRGNIFMNYGSKYKTLILYIRN
ncbi:MAG: hypothetical protein K2Q26_08985 [Bdellovibrionales bacterium]|nr:hypothetical protein [Bdellovibrionales bacterium]